MLWTVSGRGDMGRDREPCQIGGQVKCLALPIQFRLVGHGRLEELWDFILTISSDKDDDDDDAADYSSFVCLAHYSDHYWHEHRH